MADFNESGVSWAFQNRRSLDNINLPGTYPKWLNSIIDGQLDCTKVFRIL